MVSAGRRDRPSVSQGLHAKGDALSRPNPPQELSDFRSIISSLEYNDTGQIGMELSDDARNRRGMNEALARAVASLNGTSEGDDWKGDLEKNAYKMLRRHPHVLWPLPCHDVPAPPELLSDEIATLAERLAPAARDHENFSALASNEHGQVWMAVQSALYHVLSLLGWTFPTHFPTPMLQKEVDRVTTNAKNYKPEALRSILSYYSWNIDRLPRSHTIAWRDILAVALGSDNPVIVRAAEKALSLLQELYYAKPEEPKLEKRTWSLHTNAPLRERSRLLRTSRDNCPSFRLMDYIAESIDADHFLSPLDSSAPEVPKGHDMLLSDSREQSWLSGVDELYASLLWDGDSDDMSDFSDVDEIPTDLPSIDKGAQSSDSDTESQNEDEESDSSSSESSSSSSSSSSASSTGSSESDSDTDSEEPDAQSSHTRKRQSPSPLPVPKRIRSSGPV